MAFVKACYHSNRKAAKTSDLTDTEKAFDKGQHSSDKIHEKQEIERTYSDPVKVTYNEPIAYIILNGKN